MPLKNTLIAEMTDDINNAADVLYEKAMDDAKFKLTAMLRQIDNAIYEAGETLKLIQPMEDGRLAIKWEDQDMGFGKADTPRLVKYKKLKKGWRYDKLSIKSIALRAPRTKAFETTTSLITETLIAVGELFKMRRNVVEKIRVMRRAATLMHKNGEDKLRSAEKNIRSAASKFQVQTHQTTA